MKQLPVLILCLVWVQNTSACTCIGPTFCNFYESNINDEDLLVFKGSFLSRDTISPFGYAVQFKVEKKYHGNIVTPNSSLYTGETYENTDSTVWVYSGGDASCHRWIEERDAIFAVYYNGSFQPNDVPFGYVPTICKSDYFPILDDQTVFGDIYERNEYMPFVEFEEIVKSGCISSSIELTDFYSKKLSIFPNPITSEFEIMQFEMWKDWNIALFDATGKQVKEIYGRAVDVSLLDSGIYFLRFVRDDIQFVKKIIRTY